MSRKPVWIVSALLATSALAGLFVFYLLWRHEPDFYQRAAVPPGSERRMDSDAFQNRVMQLSIDIEQAQEGSGPTEWQETFTDQQVNSWLAEDFVSSNLSKSLPPDISDPRVVFKPGRVLLAFRYGTAESLTSVVSLEARVWLSQKEPNVVAVQIESLRAGALPLSLKTIQDHLSDSADALNIDLQWYRHEGQPVAILRFQKDKREPTFLLQALDLREGGVHLKGQSIDPDVRRAAEMTVGLRSETD